MAEATAYSSMLASTSSGISGSIWQQAAGEGECAQAACRLAPCPPPRQSDAPQIP